MKFRKHIVLVLIFIICLTGCSGKDNKLPGEKSNVDKVLEEQINAVNANADSEKTEIKNDEVKSGEVKNDEIKSEKSSGEQVDYDLTAMGRDMVYATVYQLMVNPEEYVGKSIKMEGIYYASYYEPTAKYYHYVIIEDATACCSQGMEFIWDDGSHVYPEEYPENEARVVVTGIFETYREEGDDNLYCRLNDASLEISQEMP
ncbi:MAG: hypothetical protein GX235_08155 [Clostridiales bacterium]|nr:hypothetical protein [Clostridiales bacterium]